MLNIKRKIWRQSPKLIKISQFFPRSEAAILTSSLNLPWRRSLSYWNQSIDLLSKSVDWFLCDKDLRHERIKTVFLTNFAKSIGKHSCLCHPLYYSCRIPTFFMKRLCQLCVWQIWQSFFSEYLYFSTPPSDNFNKVFQVNRVRHNSGKNLFQQKHFKASETLTHVNLSDPMRF